RTKGRRANTRALRRPDPAPRLLRSPCALRRVAPPALDHGVVEQCCVLVLACDDDNLVPDARIDDPVAVHLSSEALLVDAGKSVTCAVHTAASVAPTHDPHNLASVT